MKRFIAAIAVAFATLLGTAVVVDARPEPAPAAVELPPLLEFADTLGVDGFFVHPTGTTWYGNFWTCYRWGDNNEGHMRCKTAGSGWTRVYYQIVPTFRSTRTGSTVKVWGPQRSVDGTSWGPWSDVVSPYGNYSSLVSLSYRITW